MRQQNSMNQQLVAAAENTNCYISAPHRHHALRHSFPLANVQRCSASFTEIVYCNNSSPHPQRPRHGYHL
jgi:hypothetical protein